MGSLIVEKCLNKTFVTKYSYGKKPIEVFLSFRKDTFEIVSSGGKQVKGNVNENVPLTEVKEIRPGKRCKDFEGPEGKKADPAQSFVIFYGNDFRLKSLSIETHSTDDYDNWIKGIQLILNTPLSYSQKKDIWTLRTFESISNGDLLTVRHCLPLTLKINRKVTSGRLQELVQIQGDHYGGGLNEQGFLALINTLLYDPNPKMQIFTDCFDGYPSHMSVDKAVDFLFSPENQVWDVSFDKVYQDMGRPLSHYWIASSHNTYLMGDQFSSESSVEAYTRCLRQGCRCIELDVFDGSDGFPVIYHQRTLVPKIPFLEVLYTIRDNAFVKSEYPVILSIENHCTVKQQKVMAKKFQEVFGDMLVSCKLGDNETTLPSPEQLKRRILIKGKVPDPGDEERSDSASSSEDSTMEQSSLKHVSKTGKMYIQNQSSEWKPYFFALKDNKLSYIEMEKERQETENSNAEEPHLRKKWFHGEVPGGAAEGKRRLLEVDHEGCFLVRNSSSFPGEYSIDFLSQREAHHIHIRSKYDENNQRLFFLDPATTFDSVYALITYYRRNPYETANFRIERFTKAVPPPRTTAHEDEPWFYKDLDRAGAGVILENIPITGAFLVRYAQGDRSRFAISFRYEQMIKHCAVQEDGRLLLVSAKTFETITDLVNYYRKHTFYKGIKLLEPVTEKLYRESQSIQTGGLPVYTHAGYYETSNAKTVTVRALHSYSSTAPEHELTFNKDDIIRNVQKHSGGWWKGDLGEERQKWFPRFFVEEMEVLESPFGALQTGSVDLGRVEIIKNNIPGGGNSECPYILNIYGSALPFRVAVNTKSEAEEWERAINATLRGATSSTTDGGLWRRRDKKIKIPKEFAQLIVYTKSISKVVPSCIRESGRSHFSMASFDEIKAEKTMAADPAFFVWLHHVQLSRIYPQGRRVDSSNFNPVRFWNFGCQLTALNYQTPDKPLQVNHGKFRENGGCGYVLKPKFMLEGEGFNPHDRNCLNSYGITPITLKITVIAGRHLFNSDRRTRIKGILNPLVEIEVVGAPFDSNKVQTIANVENGLTPYWKQKFEFLILNPELAFLRFVVQHEDTFGDPIFISQATYPVRCLRQGYRSVPLQNGFGEELLSTLLIRLTLDNGHSKP